jgi:hypothetical protein
LNAEENLQLHSISLQLDRYALLLQELNLAVSKRQIDEERQKALRDVPEWVNLDEAHKLKGGGALNTIKTRYYYQPCCGLNYKYIDGRKCWSRDVILEWLTVTDDQLLEYAQKYKASIPDDVKTRFKELSK